MKKIYAMIGLWVLLFTACNNDEDMQPTCPTPEDTMKISVSNELIELDESKHNEVAVTFAWNPAAQREQGAEIKYYVKYWLTADPSLAIEKVEIASNAREFTLSHKQLYDYLIEDCKVTRGEKVDMEVEVIADIHSTTYLKPEVSLVSFTVSTN